MAPQELRNDISALQTLPDAERLRGLAAKLARRTWVDYRLVSAARHYRDLLADVALSPGAGYLGGQTGEVASELDQALVFDREIELGGLRLVRALDPKELPPPASRIVDFARVRAEVWRYRFDASSSRLKATRLLETTLVARP
jgi:hypothetical protein